MFSLAAMMIERSKSIESPSALVQLKMWFEKIFGDLKRPQSSLGKMPYHILVDFVWIFPMVLFVFLHIFVFKILGGAEIKPPGIRITPEPPGVRGLRW